MKKKALLFSFVILTANSVFGQVGVNTDTPSATLDVTASSTSTTTADGIIAPRVTLANLQTKDNYYTSSQTGALVYVTDNTTGTPTGKTAQVTSVGYYYFDGSVWQAIVGGRVSIPTEAWQVQEESIQATSNSENIYQTGKVAIGTDTSGDDQFYVNGSTTLNGATTITGDAKITGNSTLGSDVYVTSDGSIGLGTTTPSAQISIVGDNDTKKVFSLVDAAAERDPLNTGYLGKVLTSDADGNGSWQVPGTSYATLGGLVSNVTSGTYINSWSTNLNTDNISYAGMYIDLPKGTYQLNFTLWITIVSGSGNATTSTSQRFGAAFFSRSASTLDKPNYATEIKSVLMNPAYASGENDFYVSGAIPVSIEDTDIATYGAADSNASTGGSTVSPKAADRVRLYLWIFVNGTVFPTGSSKMIYSRTQAAGSYGPYTQLYALPFSIQK